MKTRIILMGLLTLVGFPLLALLGFYVFDDGLQSFLNILKTRSSYPTEILSGLLFGSTAGLSAWTVVQSRFMKNVKNQYAPIVADLDLNIGIIVFLSFCAGVGEEYFFRGFVQPYWGIWITALFFVGIHGYLNPKNWRLTIYGVLMTVLIAFAGWMSSYFGLVSAMIYHCMIDVVLFYNLSKVD